MTDSKRLDLSFLERALGRFDTSLTEYAAEPQRRANRDSVIVHFLLTYELVIQAIKRYLELESLKSADVTQLSFQTMIRRADDLGLMRTGCRDSALSVRRAMRSLIRTMSSVH